jgi:azurin
MTGKIGGVVDAAGLAAALATGHEADEACRLELAQGAQLRHTSEAGPVEHFQHIYSIRIDHLRRKGIRFVGEDAVERLTASGHEQVRVAGVHGSDNFVVFLAPDEDRVVATIGVEGSVANPDFDW